MGGHNSASEVRRFQTHGKINFTEVQGKSVCLVCNEIAAVTSEYNVQQDYESQHQSYNGAIQKQKVKQTAASMHARQQYIFPC